MSSICDDSYNKLTRSRNMIYKILENLMLNNEEIWRLLKYPTPDALSQSKSDLTLSEKGQLIYNGEEDQSGFRVFRQPFLEDGFNEETTQLRAYIYNIDPDNRVWGSVDFIIQVLCHNGIVNLENYENRLEVMLQQVIETLNGTEIDGLGKLFFDKTGRGNNNARMNLFNNKDYLGYTIIMSTRIG